MTDLAPDLTPRIPPTLRAEPAGLAPDDRPFVSVVIPAFNEAAIIAASLQRVCAYVATIRDRYVCEIVVVNDGSSDATGEIAELFALDHPDVRVLHHPVNFNLGQALRFAFGTCRGEYVVTLDCDLTYGPEHIGALLDALRERRARVALASPYMRGGRTSSVPFVRRWLSRAANRFLSLTAEGRLSTLTGMVRAYDRVFLQSLDLKAMGTDINAEILYKAQILRARVVEVPAHLDWTELRAANHQRSAPIRIRRASMSYLFSGFMFRPVIFFVVPGLLLLAVAGYELVWVAWQVLGEYGRLSGGIDPRFSRAIALTFQRTPHSFLIGGITLLLSVQLIAVGIVASQAKRYFEELFHLGTSLRRQLIELRPTVDRQGRDAN